MYYARLKVQENIKIGRVASRQTPVWAKLPDTLTQWTESFIFSGSSALLLLIASLFPHYWYFSFFALTPFLYKIIKASPKESLRLGFLFGISFFGVSIFGSRGLSFDLLGISLIDSVLKLILGTALFTLFGWSIGWLRQRWGFNPTLVALFWIGLETGLMKMGFVGGLLGKLELSHPFLHGLAGLFGFLTLSAIIVLLNSLLVLAIDKTLELSKPKTKTAQEDKKIYGLLFIRNLFPQKVYLVPEGRAPPSCSLLFELNI